MAKKTISSDYTTWTGTSKKDKVYIDYADNVKVNTGKGNDSIYNHLGYYATINTGSGNDTIKLNSGNGSSINAGSGNDRISLYGGYSDVITIKGGTGNDKIYGSGNKTLHQYTSGDGNDVIFNWSANDTISITGGTYTEETVGNDVILTVGKGKITLKGAANTTLNIDGTLAGGKNISNETSYKKITGTSYADTISNRGDYVTISGGKGKDSVNNTGSNVSISGGTGNDTIWSTNGYNSYVTIDGGSGNNRLELWGKNSLIKGGKNNDTVFVHGKNVTVTSGSGADFIENWDDNVGRSDDGNGKAKIFAGAGNDSVLNYGSGATINAGTGNDTITFRSHIRDGIIYSSKENVVQYANGDGKDTIFGFSSTDTLKITGAKYTRSTVGNDVVLKVGKGSITLKDAANTTINIDGTLAGGNSNNVSIPSRANGDPNDALTYKGHSYYIYSDVANTWEEAQAYCEARGGHLAVINDDDENHMLFIFMKAAGYTSAYFGLSDAAKEGTWTWVNGESVNYTNWANGEPNSESSNEDYAEFYYKFSDGKWNDGNFKHGTVGDTRAFICEWDTVTTGGGTSTVTVPADTVPSGDDIHGTSGHDYLLNGYSLNYSGKGNCKSGINIFGYTGNDTITNRGNNVYISGGDGNDSIQSRYNTSNVTVYGGDGHDRITVSGSDALIYGENGDDYIYNDGSNAKIFGDAGNDYIYAVGSRSSIYGGSDNDSIYVSGNTNGFVDGGTGNDTIKAYYGDNLSLKGGYGNDLVSLSGGAACIIQYSNGDGYDTVIGFNGNDTLNISGNYTRETVGSNVVFNVGSGSITLKDAANTTINIDTNYFAGNDEFWGNADVDDFIHSSGGNDFGNDSLTLDSLDFTTSSSQMNGSVTLKEFTTTFKTNDDAYKITASNIFKK